VRRFVLLNGIGEAVVVEDVTATELEAATRFMLGRAEAMYAAVGTKPVGAGKPSTTEPIVIAPRGR
jgi:hypothetical protein